MSVEIKIPSLGESILEATIGAILKPSGSLVRVDEEILEIETEKVNQPLYAPATGYLALSVRTGDRVKVGQVIGVVKAEALAMTSESSMPVTKAALSTPIVTPASSSVTQKEGETRKKMSMLRRVIAEKLVEVKNQTAMLTTFNEVDLSALLAAREQAQGAFQKKYGVKLGLMSFFVKAVWFALREFPDMNARIEHDEIVYSSFCHMGIAVSTERGLLVPVLRHAEKMSYGDIETTLKQYAEEARLGTIKADTLQGGTFTITNGGVFGSLLSTPILNPQQSAILGMHQIVKRPVVVEEQIVIRPMMYLAVSYDHRIVDGRGAISFLVRIKQFLESPLLWAIESELLTK